MGNVYLHSIPQVFIFHICFRALTADVSIHEKRFYFGSIKLNTKRVTLNMLTSSNMPPDLLAIKHSIGVPLVKFEDVKVDLGTTYY